MLTISQVKQMKEACVRIRKNLNKFSNQLQNLMFPELNITRLEIFDDINVLNTIVFKPQTSHEQDVYDRVYRLVNCTLDWESSASHFLVNRMFNNLTAIERINRELYDILVENF